MGIKINKAVKQYNGFKGGRTLDAIMEQIPEELNSKLTSSELALVMQVVNSAYHNGRASTGAENVGGAIWIDSIQKLVDIDKIKEIV